VGPKPIDPAALSWAEEPKMNQFYFILNIFSVRIFPNHFITPDREKRFKRKEPKTILPTKVQWAPLCQIVPIFRCAKASWCLLHFQEFHSFSVKLPMKPCHAFIAPFFFFYFHFIVGLYTLRRPIHNYSISTFPFKTWINPNLIYVITN